MSTSWFSKSIGFRMRTEVGVYILRAPAPCLGLSWTMLLWGCLEKDLTMEMELWRKGVTGYSIMVALPISLLGGKCGFLYWPLSLLLCLNHIKYFCYLIYSFFCLDLWLKVLGAFEWSGNNPLPPEIWLLPYILPIHPGALYPRKLDIVSFTSLQIECLALSVLCSMAVL